MGGEHVVLWRAQSEYKEAIDVLLQNPRPEDEALIKSLMQRDPPPLQAVPALQQALRLKSGEIAARALAAQWGKYGGW